MCGLVGAYGRFNKTRVAAVKQMMYLDQVRGDDSTGLFAANRDQYINRKETGTPQHGFFNKETNEFLRGRGLQVMVGHNRAATRGVVNKANAHPFIHGNVALAHNGTLKDRKLEETNNFGTDSEGVAWAMNEHNPAHVWKNLNGAACLTWFDMDTCKMNIIRNADRPMYFAYTTDASCVFWASERWMLDYIVEFSNIQLDTVMTPNPHQHFQFSYDGTRVTEVPTKLVPFLQKPYHTHTPSNRVVHKPAPVVHLPVRTQAGPSKDLLSNLQTHLIPTSKTTKTTSSGTTEPTRPSTLWGKILLKAKNELAQRFNVCLMCGDQPAEKGEGKAVPFDHDLCLCNECAATSKGLNLETLSPDFYQKELRQC